MYETSKSERVTNTLIIILKIIIHYILLYVKSIMNFLRSYLKKGGKKINGSIVSSRLLRKSHPISSSNIKYELSIPFDKLILDTILSVFSFFFALILKYVYITRLFS